VSINNILHIFGVTSFFPILDVEVYYLTFKLRERGIFSMWSTFLRHTMWLGSQENFEIEVVLATKQMVLLSTSLIT